MRDATKYRRLELLAAYRFWLKYRTIGGFNRMRAASINPDSFFL